MDNTLPYIPINCSFYDYLEEAATLKQKALITYFEQGETLQVEARIKTLFIKKKVEYMLLENEQNIRLDNLVSFNGKPLPKSC